MTIDKDNDYTKMQLALYDREASYWKIDDIDRVVGAFHAHNNHADYDLLFKDMACQYCATLDFGCGPGRNLVKYANKFAKFDGCDISQINLDKAKVWLEHNNLPVPTLWQTDGISLNPIPNHSYDIIMSTITLQHIPVHEIRYNIFKDMYRVLNNGGWITIQMGYGPSRQGAVGYSENRYEAPGSNGDCDVLVTDPKQLEDDLTKIGFKDFSHIIAQVGPGDVHDNWIFFRAKKEIDPYLGLSKEKFYEKYPDLKSTPRS